MSKSWKAIKEITTTKTSYTHTSSSKFPISIGQKYQYSIRGYNKKTRKWSDYSASLSVKALPSKVELIGVGERGDDYSIALLRWYKAEGATAYRIYYKESGGSWKTLTTVGGNVTRYKHKITPYDKRTKN